MVAGEKTSAEVAEEKQKAEAAHMDMTKAMMIAQTAIMGTQVGLTALLAKRRLAAAVGGIFESMSGWPLGLGLLAAGGIVAAMYAQAKSAPKLLTGGFVKESGMAEVHKGEAFSGTKNEMGFGTDMRQTNKLIRELITQNAFLMNRLTGRIDSLALSN